MLDDKLWLRVERPIDRFGYSIYPILTNNTSERRSYVKEIIWSTIPDFTESVNPQSFDIDNDATKRLMTELWLMGVRPDKNVMGEANKDDMRNHLEDMRKLVFRGDMDYKKMGE